MNTPHDSVSDDFDFDPPPRFKVGDKVRVRGYKDPAEKRSPNGCVGVVTDNQCLYQVDIGFLPTGSKGEDDLVWLFTESELEPA